MGGPPCVQLGCGHSAARRCLHRSSLRDPLSSAAHRASRREVTLKNIINAIATTTDTEEVPRS